MHFKGHFYNSLELIYKYIYIMKNILVDSHDQFNQNRSNASIFAQIVHINIDLGPYILNFCLNLIHVL